MTPDNTQGDAQGDLNLTPSTVLRFHPSGTVNALRDARYPDESGAIAELIDNSFDANARNVDVLLERSFVRVNTRNNWRIVEIAVVDNGDGMDDLTLARALCFGYSEPDKSAHRIGKYGMGLLTASASQADILEVWTWTEGIKKPRWVSFDAANIPEDQFMVPPPEFKEIDPKWLRRLRSEFKDSPNGTLVVWRQILDITTQPATIVKRMEQSVSRVYRHFLQFGEYKIRIASFRNNDAEHVEETFLKPNDPLYQMKNSATPGPHWDVEPMFEPYGPNQGEYEFEIAHDEKKIPVTIRSSIVREETLVDLTRRGTRNEPGSTPEGRHARSNMGVSIVRAQREVELDDRLARTGHATQPSNRFWGMEVEFSRELDDIFGLDHNKTTAAKFSAALKHQWSLTDEEISENQDQDDYGEDSGDLYVLAGLICRQARNLSGEARKRVKKIRDNFKSLSGGDIDGPNSTNITPEKKAEDASTHGIEAEVERGQKSLTDTTRHDKPDDIRKEELRKHYEKQGLHQSLAERMANQAILGRTAVQFTSGEVSHLFDMFDVQSAGGIVNICLNNKHPLYEFLYLLKNPEEDESDHDKHDAVTDALAALYLLICAWARMEDYTHNETERAHIQKLRTRWGEHASNFCSELLSDEEE